MLSHLKIDPKISVPHSDDLRTDNVWSQHSEYWEVLEKLVPKLETKNRIPCQHLFPMKRNQKLDSLAHTCSKSAEIIIIFHTLTLSFERLQLVGWTKFPNWNYLNHFWHFSWTHGTRKVLWVLARQWSKWNKKII